MRGKTLIEKAEHQINEITVRERSDVNVINLESTTELLNILRTYGKSMHMESAVMLPQQSKLICFGKI